MSQRSWGGGGVIRSVAVEMLGEFGGMKHSG